MKSVMLKTTFREIRHSFGRYIAILAIIALGVGFFAGLKATKPAIVGITEEYLTELNFYDFRLLSTLGFDEENIELFQEQKGVETAVGSYSFDVICESSDGENSFVMKAHSITEGVNDLYLIAGRMPQNPEECVLDSSIYDKSHLGHQFRISEDNQEEDLEHFAYKEYTVVGIVQSPLYIQFERGNTSIGNGQVNGFVYLMPEAFHSEAYTEAYIKFKEDFPLHSEEYNDFIKDKEEDWSLYLKDAAAVRAERIREDAENALKNAEEELEEEKTKAEKELEDSRIQLEEAKEEIENGKKQLEQAKNELSGGREELIKQEKLLAEGEKEINDNEALLLEKETELEAGVLTWQENNKKIMESKTQLRVAEAELSSKENQLSYIEQQMGVFQTMIDLLESQIDQKEAEIAADEAALKLRQENLSAYEAEMKAEYGETLPTAVRTEIERERAQITADQLRMDTQKTYLEELQTLLEENLLVQYDVYVKQLEDGRKQLEEGKQQIIAGWSQLDQGEQELNKAWAEIVSGRAQIDLGKTEIAKARQELADGRLEIAKAKKTMEDGEEEIAENEKKLAEGEREYQKGLADYKEGVKEFETKIADAEKEILNARRKIKEINDPDTYILGRNTNVGYVCFESDSNIVEDVSDVFPFFFFLVAALVCMTTMSRMIEEQRTQIGVLKGLGYSEMSIMSKYVIYSGSAALIGCLAGFFLFTYIFPVVIWFCYGIMYDVLPVHYYFDWKMLVISLAVSLLCSVGTTWYCCRNELKEVAAQLMRPKTPEAGKRIFLEKIDFIWKRLKFLQKVSLRNVFRYKKRFFMMVIGISGCTALIVAGLGMNDSVAEVTNQQYTEILKYDMSITFSDEITEEILEEFEEVIDDRSADYCIVMEKALDLQVDDITKSINLILFEKPSQIKRYVDLHTTKDDPVLYPVTGQVVMTHKIADTYDLKVGNTVTLLDEKQKSLEATLSGINENFVMNYVFMTEETYEQGFGRAAEYRTIYLNVEDEETVDVHLLAADIMKMYDVSAVTVNQDTMERFDVMMGTLDYIVGLVILCAAALAFIVLYNLTNINITERIREIATIKVLGFYKKEACTYVFRENMMLTVIGSVIGLLLGKILHEFIMSCINVDMVSFDVRVTVLSYLSALLLTYLFATFVNLFMRKKIDSISMTESLKSVD